MFPLRWRLRIVRSRHSAPRAGTAAGMDRAAHLPRSAPLSVRTAALHLVVVSSAGQFPCERCPCESAEAPLCMRPAQVQFEVLKSRCTALCPCSRWPATLA